MRIRWWGRPSPVALWRDEFSVSAADERYVNRRQFAKFLVLTSLGMFVGQLWAVVRAWLVEEGPPPPPRAVARADELPVGGVKVFHYPGERDACLLIRLGPDRHVAFSQKCTHLSCAVYYTPEERRLFCPCHDGCFSAEDGRVVQGPPPRPLPRVRLEQQGGWLLAVAVEVEAGEGRGRV